MHLRFFDREKVPMKHPGKPHRMKIKISDYDRKMGIQLILCDQVRDNTRRHEMSADRDVGVELTDEFHQGSGIKAIQHQAHAGGLLWPAAPAFAYAHALPKRHEHTPTHN